MTLRRLVSPGEATSDFLKFLFLFFDLLVKMWLVYAWLRLTLPVPVLLNRFAALLFVFILGIKIPSSDYPKQFCFVQMSRL